jgi:hypothetical protein
MLRRACLQQGMVYAVVSTVFCFVFLPILFIHQKNNSMKSKFKNVKQLSAKELKNLKGGAVAPKRVFCINGTPLYYQPTIHYKKSK